MKLYEGELHDAGITLLHTNMRKTPTGWRMQNTYSARRTGSPLHLQTGQTGSRFQWHRFHQLTGSSLLKSWPEHHVFRVPSPVRPWRSSWCHLLLLIICHRWPCKSCHKNNLKGGLRIEQLAHAVVLRAQRNAVNITVNNHTVGPIVNQEAYFLKLPLGWWWVDQLKSPS